MTGDSLLRRVVTRRLWPPQLCASTWHRRSLSSAPSKVSAHTQCLTWCWQLVISASHAAVFDRNARQKKEKKNKLLFCCFIANNLLQIIYALRLLCCEWVWWRCNPDPVKKKGGGRSAAKWVADSWQVHCSCLCLPHSVCPEPTVRWRHGDGRQPAPCVLLWAAGTGPQEGAPTSASPITFRK